MQEKIYAEFFATVYPKESQYNLKHRKNRIKETVFYKDMKFDRYTQKVFSKIIHF